MAASPNQVLRAVNGPHLVLYDGVCVLCNGLLQFLLKHDRRAVFNFAPLQSNAGRTLVTRLGGNPVDLVSFYVVTNYRTGRPRILNKSAAAAFVAGELGWPWKVAALAQFVPQPIRDRVYDVVAGARYRLFGRLDACPVLPPEFRRRFIDE